MSLTSFVELPVNKKNKYWGATKMAKRIDSKTSRTAQWTCTCRVISFLETNEQYHSDDYVSLLIVPSFLKGMFKFSFGRRCFVNLTAKGIYEYVIARTKYIDSEFTNTLKEGCDQVLIFGAGFDSRGIRFPDLAQNTRIFELDVPITQNAKIGRYKEKGIKTPENLIFVPIDFEKQSIAERLNESGFIKGQKCLFILEGLIMYLQPEALERTFRIIQEYAGPGSKIIFDYIYASVLRKENLYYGEQDMVRRVSKAKEAWVFGIEKGKIKEFLAQYGFKMLDHSDSNDLEQKFFKDKDGKITGRVNGTHCLVTAVKR